MTAAMRRTFGRGDYGIASYMLELAGFAEGSHEHEAYLRHASESALRHRCGLAQSVRQLLSSVDRCAVALRVRPRMVGELTTRGDAMTYTHPDGMVAIGSTSEPEALLNDVEALGRLDAGQLDALAEAVTEHARVVLSRV